MRSHGVSQCKDDFAQTAPCEWRASDQIAIPIHRDNVSSKRTPSYLSYPTVTCGGFMMIG